MKYLFFISLIISNFSAQAIDCRGTLGDTSSPPPTYLTEGRLVTVPLSSITIDMQSLYGGYFIADITRPDSPYITQIGVLFKDASLKTRVQNLVYPNKFESSPSTVLTGHIVQKYGLFMLEIERMWNKPPPREYEEGQPVVTSLSDYLN